MIRSARNVALLMFSAVARLASLSLSANRMSASLRTTASGVRSSCET
jgi:hypothetical protein